MASCSHDERQMRPLRELRQSLRSFSRTPGASVLLLLTIALGVGSNAAVVGFTRGSIARDLPLAHAGSIVSLFARDDDRFGPVSFETYVALEAQHQMFETVGAARQVRTTITVNGHSSVASVAAITPDVADFLQLSLDEGVVVSHRWWQREIGGTAIDRPLPLQIDGTDTRVIAIAPEWLEGLYSGSDVDVWMPLNREASLASADRRSRTIWAFGRLRPGVSPNDAEAVINAARRGGGPIAVLPYTGMTPDVARGLLRVRTLLSAAAAAVFFIACVNVATFLLSRAFAQSHETSVRVALGASRQTLLEQLLADSLLLSATGAALGMLAASWTTHLVAASLFAADAERLVFAPDRTGIAAVSIICAAITTACGLLPILQIRADRPAAVLRRESAGPSTLLRRLRLGLIGAQMTCCCVLVIFTALVLADFRQALETREGHRLEHGILATVQASANFERPDLGLAYFRGVEDVARSVPDAAGFAWSGVPPGSRPGWLAVRIERPDVPLRSATMSAASLTPTALDEIELPPVAGRLFGIEDTPDRCKVVVVNTEAANFFDGEPVGQSIVDPDGRRVDVIGIVASRTRDASIRPTVFYYPQQLDVPANSNGPFRIPGPRSAVRGILEANVVSRSYFETTELRVAAGRLFDDVPHGCREAVIDEEAAELYFGGDAVGGALVDNAGRRTIVVGVVRSSMLRASQRRAEAAVYFPMTQDFLPRMTLVFGARDTNEDTLRLLRRRIAAVAGGLPDKTVVTTLQAHLTKTALAPERIAVVLVAGSAGIALALGVLGLYGAMIDTTRQRRRECAVRAALGAPVWHVMGQVVIEGVQVALAGAAAGVVVAIVLARRIGRFDAAAPAWTWFVGPLVLLGAVGLAAILPARDAARVNLLTIMRE